MSDSFTRSVSFCFVLQNPFFYPVASGAPAPERLLLRTGAPPPKTVSHYLEDEMLLRLDPSESTGGLGLGSSPTHSQVEMLPNTPPLSTGSRFVAPTRHQKVIDIILRLQTKNFDLDPPDMLRHRSIEDGPTPLVNELGGWVLQEDRLYLSPDKDEMYIRITSPDAPLLQFAEAEGLYLNTHPLSFAGGQPMPYTNSLARHLKESVETFLSVFPDARPGVSTRFTQRSGFLLDVPDRSRIILRIIREATRYHGCGIQFGEMRRAGVLVLHFFPLHQLDHITALDLPKWGSLRTFLSREPFYQDEEKLVQYFGEEVALYFFWTVEFCKALRFLAAFGVVCGLMGAVATPVGIPGMETMANGIFAVMCVMWGMWWNLRWMRREQIFSLVYGQDAQMSQEMVRDEFEPEGEPVPVTIEKVFNEEFDVPLTLKRVSDGSLVNLSSNTRKRLLVRYLIGYPVVLSIVVAMVVVMSLLTWWRLMVSGSSVVSFASSILSTISAVLFAALFDFAIRKLNSAENNRTDSEEASQVVSKSFLFHFFAKYFTMFSIMLWPSWASGTTPVSSQERLQQVTVQMITTSLIKPFVADVKSMLGSVISTELRVRSDLSGGSKIGGLVSLVRRDTVDMTSHYDPTAPPESRARRLWLQAQLQPFESTAPEFLELSLLYGYMTMFAATLPWSALATLFYATLELRVDAWKLLNYHQRPVAKPANSIGPWNSVGFFLLCISLATNGYLLSVMTGFSDDLGVNADSEAQQYQMLAVTHYVFLALLVGVYAVMSRGSNRALRVKAKQQLLSNFATRKRIEATLDGLQRQQQHRHFLQQSAASPSSSLQGPPGGLGTPLLGV